MVEGNAREGGELGEWKWKGLRKCLTGWGGAGKLLEDIGGKGGGDVFELFVRLW